MSEINIIVEGGKSKRLLTAGKYCEDNIVVIAGSDIPTTYMLSSADELPEDAIDGSIAIVDNGDDTLGTWKLNNELDFSGLPDMDNEYALDFSSNGVDFISFDLYPNAVGYKNGTLKFWSADGGAVPVYTYIDDKLVLNAAYQSFHINDYPEDNEVMTWIRENAEKAKLIYIRIDGEWVLKYSTNENTGGPTSLPRAEGTLF